VGPCLVPCVATGRGAGELDAPGFVRAFVGEAGRRSGVSRVAGELGPMDIEFCGRRNFLGLSEGFSSKDRSFFHVIPVPYDATSTYGTGSRLGPRALIDASTNLEVYDHELDMEPVRAGVYTHPELEVSVGDPRYMVELIEEEVDEVVSGGRFPVLLGGEHTVSLGAIRALARKTKFSVVSLDAHADLRDTYQGSPYSHACFFRRALESADGLAIGVRSVSREELEFAKGAGIPLVFAHRIAGGSPVDLNLLGERIYVSIDLDVLDPSIMPSTGTPEPGGLSWYGATALLESLVAGREVVGFDVVELCPQPGNRGPDFTAAKLVYRIMGLVLRSLRTQGKDRIGDAEKEAEEAAG
jgi:agmatinase